MKKIVILLLVLLIVSCSSNKKNNEIVPNDLEKLENVGSFTVLWKQKLGGTDGAGYKLIPSFNKGNLYVATQEGAVYSIDATSGEINWKVKTEIELSAGPGISDTLLVVGSSEGNVIALDVESGAAIWNTNVTSEVLSPPVIDRNVVVVRAHDGRVYGFDIQNGKRIWVIDTNIPNLTLRGNSTLVAKGGRLYVGFDNGKVAALNIADGSILWQQNVVNNKDGKTEIDRMADIDGDINVVATELYVSSVAGKSMSIATESGRVLWVQDFGSVTGVTVSRRSIYLSDTQSIVRQLNRTDGSTGWVQKAFLHRELTKPAYYFGDLLLGDLEGYIHVLDSTSGNILARTKVGGESFSHAPLVVAGTIYSYNLDGSLSAIKYKR